MMILAGKFGGGQASSSRPGGDFRRVRQVDNLAFWVTSQENEISRAGGRTGLAGQGGIFVRPCHSLAGKILKYRSNI